MLKFFEVFGLNSLNGRRFERVEPVCLPRKKRNGRKTLKGREREGPERGGLLGIR